MELIAANSTQFNGAENVLTLKANEIVDTCKKLLAENEKDLGELESSMQVGVWKVMNFCLIQVTFI